MKYELQTYTVHSLAREPVADRSLICCAEDAARVARDVLAREDHDREHYLVIALDARNRAVGTKIVTTGTASACLVHPREIFHAAIVFSAVSLIVAHNHPSGDVEQSPEDIALADRLRSAGDLMGIPVHDSIVVDLDSERYSVR